MHFVALDAIAEQHVSPKDAEKLRQRYGGKGANLGILCQMGFPVPAGFVIPTAIFEEVMLDGLRAFPAYSPQQVLEHIEFSSDFIETLRSAMGQIGASSWAVRSSSTDEDSDTHSMAGLQQSIIGIRTPEACLEAVRSVWMSFYARERLLYPTQNCLTAPVPSMAVIVQAFVDSDAAGVVFTQHPFEGEHSLLINVSRGQGANVVDGKNAESLSVEKKETSAGGQSECLTAQQIDELAKTAIQIEQKFGRAQDIEFAFENDRLLILQTRDIVQNRKQESRTLYSNVNVGEALSGVATPMTWSVGMHIAERGFERIFASFGFSVPEDYDFVATFNGHIYINISQVLSVASQVPFIQPTIFAKIVGLQSLDEYAFSIEPMSRAHFIRNIPRSFVELLKIQKQIFALPKRAQAFERRRDALLATDLTHASLDEIRRAFAELDDVFCGCAMDMLTAGGVFMASYIACSAFIDHFDENETNELEQYMFSGLLDVQSAAPGLALLDMAAVIHNHKDLADAFIEEPDFNDLEGFENKIRPIEGYVEFETLLQRFMALYGARAAQEAELANPRWREDPRFLYRVVKAHLKSGIRCDTQNIAAAVSGKRERHTNEFRNMLSRTMRPVFRSLLGMAQKNARLREVWRAYVVDVLGIFRKFYLEVAEQWVRAGIFIRRDDIFFMTYDEFLNGVSHPENLSGAALTAAFRRARHEACLTACALPNTFVTHPNQCSDFENMPSSRVLRGIPASPGCVRARVRVAQSIDEAAELEYGEILVAKSTDVAWTPLFLVASAILTECGGPLSHAFVVAREYGIPAVVSVPGVTSALKTGDIVRVSGLDGTVEF